jgi:hypothetical protein
MEPGLGSTQMDESARPTQMEHRRIHIDNNELVIKQIIFIHSHQDLQVVEVMAVTTAPLLLAVVAARTATLP